MSVRFGSPDLLPHLSVLYTCRRCGRTAARHGRSVAELPPGWVELRGGDEREHACARCARDGDTRGARTEEG